MENYRFGYGSWAQTPIPTYANERKAEILGTSPETVNYVVPFRSDDNNGMNL
jgi:hypothetical protein